MHRGSRSPWHWDGRVCISHREVLWGTGVGLGLCFALVLCPAHLKDPQGLSLLPLQHPVPSAVTPLCCSSAAASPPAPEQSCVKHADVFIIKLMPALRACAQVYPVLFKSVPEQPFPATAKQKLFQQNSFFLFSVRKPFFSG